MNMKKVESIRQQSAKSMQEAINRQKSLLSLTLPDSWTDIQQFVDSLNSLNTHHGHLYFFCVNSVIWI